MKSVSDSFTFDIRKTRVLQELRVRGTISATADALHLTPSAVSQQIAALSRETGVPLLVRHGRGVRLTQQAHLLLEHAAVVRAQLERMRADFSGYSLGEVGQVTVGGFATAISGLIAPVIASLRRDRPRMHLAVREIEAPDCFTSLDSGGLDLVIAVDHRNGPPHTDPRYFRLHLLDDIFEIALPETHLLVQKEVIELRDLANEVWVFGAVGGICHEVSIAACTAAGFSPHIGHHTNDWSAVLSLVASDCGVALIPRLALPAGGLPGVVLRPTTGAQRPARHIYAAVRAGAERSPSLSPILASLQETATKRVSGAHEQ